jgi:hypothetical protein
VGKDESPSWGEVLASFEAAADAAEALLRPDPSLTDEATHQVEYDPWQLALPPLPVKLLERAKAIHARQQALMARLQRSSLALHQQEVYTRSAGRCADPVNGQHRPIFVDRQV